jgi:hypothetical protein
LPMLSGECYTCPAMQLVVLSFLVISMDEEEKKLLASAHAVVHDSQRQLHSISDEARLVCQQRLGEWERCRRSLEQLGALKNPHATGLGGCAPAVRRLIPGCSRTSRRF